MKKTKELITTRQAANKKISVLLLFFLFQLMLFVLPLAGYSQLNTLVKQNPTTQNYFPSNFIRGFEPNSGQVGNFEGEPVSNIFFSLKERGFSLFLKPNGVSYVIYEDKNKEEIAMFNDKKKNTFLQDNSEKQYARIDIELINANIQTKC